MKNNQDNKKTTLNRPLLIISIILLIVSIIIPVFTVLRLLMWITSVIILAINIKKFLSYTTTKTIIISIIMLLTSIIIDGIISYTFNKIPVFTYNILNTNNTIVYSSLGMKTWQCDKNNYKDIKVAPFYENGYMCNVDNIETIDINTFLNSVVNNHSEYKNKYVKIKGKISKKSGLNSLEMRPYEKTDNQVNGYVSFSDNITLKVLFDEDDELLDKYDVYDEITIIGVIKNLDTTSNNHIVYMSGTKIVSKINLKEYTLSITKEKKCGETPTEISKTPDLEIYKYCLTDIIVTFPDGQYEIESALSSNKITIEDLLSNYNKKEEYPDTTTIMYKFEDYNILVCDKQISNKVFIGPKKMKIDSVNCQVDEEELN